MAHIAVTIANWNGLDFLQPCLDSLHKQTHAVYSIIVLDNGSTDGSVEWLAKNAPDVEVLQLSENSGFAPAHNIALTVAFEDPAVTHVLTLNNDTELHETFVQEMLNCMERHPNAASIQGKMLNAQDHSIIDAVGVLIHPDMSGYNRGQKQTDVGQFNTETEIMGPSASAALYARSALEQVALAREPQTYTTVQGRSITVTQDYFDSSYFAYYEDVDLLWRLRLAGFTSWYTPAALAYHHHSATGIIASPFKAFHIHRNHFYNMIKDAPLPFLLVAILILPLRYCLLVVSVLRGKGAASRLSQNVKKGVDSSVVASPGTSGGASAMIGIVLRAWKETLIALPLLLKKRRAIQRSRQVPLRIVAHWFRAYHVSWKNIFFE